MDQLNNIDDLFSAIDSIVEDNVDEIFGNFYSQIKRELSEVNKLLPPAELYEQKKQEVKAAIQSVNGQLDRFKEAVAVFNHHKDTYLTHEELSRFDAEVGTVNDRFIHISADNLDIHRQSLKEILGISDFILYCYYVVAYQLFEKRAFRDASHLFFFAATLNPLIKDYWMALASSERADQQFGKAVEAFQMAAFTDPNDPAPPLAIVECHLRSGNIREAELQLVYAQDVVYNYGSESWKKIVLQLSEEIIRRK